MADNNTRRFSNRVADYVTYRPHYPQAIIGFLEQQYHLAPGMRIADIGAGTGISAKLFLDSGYEVDAVEPNEDMRGECATMQQTYPLLLIHDGTAAHSRLPDHFADGIVCGQAFHWFDAHAAKLEFRRILKKGGIIILMWNERRTVSPFEQEYDRLIVRHATDYVQVDHRNISHQDIAAFYHPASFQLEVFANEQLFDLNGLVGRLLSSSYMPARDQTGFEQWNADLQALFIRHAQNNKVTISYDTKVYVGRVAG